MSRKAMARCTVSSGSRPCEWVKKWVKQGCRVKKVGEQRHGPSGESRGGGPPRSSASAGLMRAASWGSAALFCLHLGLVKVAAHHHAVERLLVLRAGRVCV